MAADPAAGALAGGEEAGAPPPDELHFNPETGEVFRRLSSGEYELVPDVILSPEEGEAALTEQEGLTVDAVPALLEMLNAEERADQEDALGLLCELVGGAFGDDGAVVGEAMRQGGAPLTLSYLLADESGNVRMQALYLMSNLASDAVDPNSAATKQALLQCGTEYRLIPCLDDVDETVLTYAAATMQNLCHDDVWSATLRRHDGVQSRLEALLDHESALVVRCTPRDASNTGRLTRAAHSSP